MDQEPLVCKASMLKVVKIRLSAIEQATVKIEAVSVTFLAHLYESHRGVGVSIRVAQNVHVFR